MSVIVPIFNGEEHLRECLSSLTRQSLREIEIIAVDNGSEDRTGAILKELACADDRIRILSIRQNIKVWGARNVGLEMASGEYIAFCDCDDTVPPRAYAAMYARCEKRRADVLSADYTEILCSRGGTRSIRHRKKRTGFYGYMLGGAVWNRLFRREFLLRYGLRFAESSHGEDTLFLAEVYAHRPVFDTTHTLVYNYYVRKDVGSSLAQKREREAVEEYARMDEGIYNAVQDTAPPKELKRYKETAIWNMCRRWWGIEDLEEKTACYPLLRDTALQTLERDAVFLRCMRVTKEEMEQMGCGAYIARLNAFDTAEQARTQFRIGGIGFRYLVLCFQGWLAFKLENGMDKLRSDVQR